MKSKVTTQPTYTLAGSFKLGEGTMYADMHTPDYRARYYDQ